MFSVCIPTYMRPSMISAAITSVLNQTYTDFELIIHDDSTNYETQKVVETFDDSRIIYKKNQETLGMHKNYNSLINASTREYIKFLNDDDTLLPNCLEVLVQNIKLFEETHKKKPSLVTLSAQYIDSNRKVIKRDYRRNAGGLLDYYVDKKDMALLWYKDAVPIRTPTHSLYLTKAIKEIGGFNESIKYAMDTDLGYRLATIDGNLILDKKPLVEFQTHGGQVSNYISLKDKILEQMKLKRIAYEQIKNKKSIERFKEIYGEIILREIAIAFKYKSYEMGFKGLYFWFRTTPFRGIKFFIRNNIIFTKQYFEFYDEL